MSDLRYTWKLRSDVVERLDLISLLGDPDTAEQVRQTGKRHRGRCDICGGGGLAVFTEERPMRFKCFACGARGDALHYHLLKRFGSAIKLSDEQIMDAAAELAPTLGLRLEDYERHKPRSAAERKQQELLRARREAFALVTDLAHRILLSPEGEEARAYLKSRHISEAEMVRSRLGYLPRFSKQVYDLLKRQGAPLPVVEYFVNMNTGIDKMHNRILIPYLQHGKVIKLTGRTLASAEDQAEYGIPKYLYLVLELGLPPIYAEEDAKKHEVVWLWESEMDTNMLRSYGAMNVMSCGGVGNLSQPKHVERFRYSRIKCVVLCPDEDPKFQGQTGFIRAGRLFQSVGIEVRVVRLAGEDGEKEDVGSFVSKYGIDRFVRLPSLPGAFLSLEQYAVRVALDKWYARLAEPFDPGRYIHSPFEMARQLQPLLLDLVPVFGATGVLTLSGQMLIQEIAQELGLPVEVVQRCVVAETNAETIPAS